MEIIKRGGTMVWRDQLVTEARLAQLVTFTKETRTRAPGAGFQSTREY